MNPSLSLLKSQVYSGRNKSVFHHLATQAHKNLKESKLSHKIKINIRQMITELKLIWNAEDIRSESSLENLILKSATRRLSTWLQILKLILIRIINQRESDIYLNKIISGLEICWGSKRFLCSDVLVYKSWSFQESKNGLHAFLIPFSATISIIFIYLFIID